MSTTNTTPYLRRYTLIAGTDWDGVRLRELDDDGDPVLSGITVAGEVRTGASAVGGQLVAACDVSSIDGSGYFTVSLSAADTASFPLRELFVDVRVTVAGVVKVPVQVTLDVVGRGWS